MRFINEHRHKAIGPMKSTRFKWLLSKYKDPVYTYAYYFLGNRFDAEDVSQEVLIRCWQHLDSIKLGTAKAWLFRTTKNMCIDFTRRHQTRQKHFDTRDQEFLANLQDSDNDDSSIDENMVKEELDLLLAKLPDTYRTLVIMREIQGFSYKEISEFLDIPLNSVKVYLHRARKGLRHLAKNKEYHHDQSKK
jgi:RNA polymerase sigma-70 factor (ECF subfamily)